MAAKKLAQSASELFLEQALRDERAAKQLVSIRAIRADTKLQSRIATDPEHARHLASLLDLEIELRPVVIFRDPKTGYLILADGFHRLMAYKSRKREAIPAYVIDGNERDAMLYSASANLENSKPTSREDRRKAALMLLSDDEVFTWNDSEIARRCGLQSMTVTKIRAEYCREHDKPLPDIVKVNSRGGGETMTKYKRSRWPSNPINVGREAAANPRLSGGFLRAASRVGQTETPISRSAAAVVATKNSSCLDSLEDLQRYFLNRCIPVLEITSLTLKLPGLVCCPADIRDTKSMLCAIGAVAVEREGPAGRAVIVCRAPLASNRIASLMEAAAGCCSGRFEFIAPEEFLAEFGHKPDDAQPSDV